MAQPTKIPVPFANDSTACNVIPETTSTPGLASWREGFPLLTSTPIADGGKAPKRADFNGIFNALSEHVIWAQNGNVYEYDNLTDYVAGNIIAENGTLYVCVAANGPGTATVDPATDTAGTAWKPLMIATGGVLRVSQGGTGQTSLDSVTVGKAKALNTGRDIQVSLASTVAANFDGTADVTPGVTGTLGVTNGGTGETTLPPMLMNALAYSATEDYTPGTLVTQNNELYVCLTANGPLSTVIAPSADTTSTYWSKVVSKTAMDSAITTAVSSAIEAEDAALMSKIFAQSTWYKRPELPTVTQTTVTIPSGTQVAIDSAMYISTSATTLSLDDFETAANRKGKDMYIYACVPPSGTEPVFVLSLNSTVPSGYTATTSRKIGGFHCECADVGVIADHPLSGYLAGDILPLSVWDLLHRAVSENEGMVYVDGQWYDIYFSTLSGGKYSSIYNGNYVRGQSGEEMAERAGAVQKRLIRRNEFLIVADGSNQMTNIGDINLRSNAGGHVDSDGRRMISNFGLEDCCGVQRQWTDDIFGAYNNTSSSYTRPGGIRDTPQTPASEGTPANRGSHDLRGYLWQDDGRGTYNVSLDGENALNSKGHAYGALARASVGGSYSDSTNCGSRCVILNYLSSYNASGQFASRLVSAERVVNL